MNRISANLRLALFALMLTTIWSCERPDLRVSSDQFKQVELAPDWTEASGEPGGMTALFFRSDGNFYRHTTADVHLTTLGLPRGDYQGVVFSYSPEEYGNMVFTGLGNAHTAAIRLKPLEVQPQLDIQLYDPDAVVCYPPESIDIDTLAHMTIVTGTDGDYIPYKDRDSYREHLVTQRFTCAPKSPLTELRIIIYITGINSLYDIKGTVEGLADGYLLIDAVPTSQTCILQTGQWEVRTLDNNSGYIMTTLPTFGVPVTDEIVTKSATRNDINLPVRLNLQLLLRDQETTLNYNYDIGSLVTTIEGSDEMRVIIGTDSDDHPDLPYVEAKGSAGFGVNVVPWSYGGGVNIDM